MFAYDSLLDRMRELQAEHALAALEGIGDDSPYMHDLRVELEGTRSAYVGAAVTSIATLRGELSGRLYG